MKAFLILFGLLLVSGVQAATGTRTSAFEYDSAGLLVKEIIEPDTPNLCLQTTYTYDSYGNKLSATTANCSGASGDAVFTSRASSTAFTSGKFPTSSTNALSQTETKAFSTAFGTVTSLTGPNSLTTTWTYDGFGRKTLETRADTTTTTWAYTACGTCPSNGRYYVTETSTGAPVKKVYYDVLNREIRSEVQGFNGTAIYKDTEYDSLGRVYRVSKPYYSGGSVVWSVFTYDALGRVTQADEPSTASGAVRTVTTYNGLTTTVEVSNAGTGTNLPRGLKQTRTTLKNSQGQVIQVSTQ